MLSRKQKHPIFVIHKHRATHLHYDLRLEMKGALKSWAVPKEPSTEEGVRRLAIRVEDHPLEYADFEGVIPGGAYGAGTVEIWDRGHYVPVKMGSHEILVELKGKKLKGVYCLIKLKSGLAQEKNWLFFKKKQSTGKLSGKIQ
ncbi:MAG TPA: DNA polymerase ligase N-terminal domain-containing protein [Candidatus Omnitrophota bacterium]|nr:DNA polymerase ligase N-terminal domain-containing protein [Candidatus Omnitrophota bacterium]